MGGCGGAEGHLGGGMQGLSGYLGGGSSRGVWRVGAEGGAEVGIRRAGAVRGWELRGGGCRGDLAQPGGAKEGRGRKRGAALLRAGRPRSGAGARGRAVDKCHLKKKNIYFLFPGGGFAGSEREPGSFIPFWARFRPWCRNGKPKPPRRGGTRGRGARLGGDGGFPLRVAPSGCARGWFGEVTSVNLGARPVLALVISAENRRNVELF